jgi:hypothetical protein
LLAEVAVQAAHIDGFLINGEPFLYGLEKVGEELGFIDENGFGGTEY